MIGQFFSLTADQLSPLAAGGAVADSHLFYAVQGGVGVKATAAQLKTYIGAPDLTAATINVGAAAVAATLQQVAPASGAGNPIGLAASAAASGNTNGGSVALKPGAKSGSGTDGYVETLKPGQSSGSTLAIRQWHDGTKATIVNAADVANSEMRIGLEPDGTGGISFCRRLLSSPYRIGYFDQSNSAYALDGGYQLAWCSGQAGATAQDTGLKRAAAGCTKATNGGGGDGSFIALKGIGTLAKAGAPTDADVVNPTDGMIVGDSAGSKIWIRLGGVWKGVVVA